MTSKMAERKKIRMKEAKEALSELDRRQDEFSISVSEFVSMNIAKLQRYGVSRRAIYDSLRGTGLQLGSFKSFSDSWRRAEAKQATTATACNTTMAEQPKQRPESEREQQGVPTQSTLEQSEEEKDGLPADRKFKPLGKNSYGTEMFFDPETGAKRFKI